MTEELTAAAQVAEDLRATEDGLDQAIASQGRLVAALAEGRRRSGYAATFGHKVFERAAETLSTLVAARAALVELHHGLGAVQRLRDLRIAPVGDKGDSLARVEMPLLPTG
jgi:hypothetical protein